MPDCDIPPMVQEMIQALIDGRQELPSIQDDKCVYDKAIAATFLGCSYLNLTDFEYDKSYHYVIRRPIVPIVLDQNSENASLRRFGTFDDIHLSISAVAPAIAMKFTHFQAGEDARWTNDPCCKEQAVLLGYAEQLASEIGFMIIPARTLEQVVENMNFGDLDLEDNTVASVLF